MHYTILICPRQPIYRNSINFYKIIKISGFAALTDFSMRQTMFGLVEMTRRRVAAAALRNRALLLCLAPPADSNCCVGSVSLCVIVMLSAAETSRSAATDNNAFYCLNDRFLRAFAAARLVEMTGWAVVALGRNDKVGCRRKFFALTQ